jgi:hypothetical protein
VVELILNGRWVVIVRAGRMSGTRRTKCRRKNGICKMEERFGVIEANRIEGSRSVRRDAQPG